VLALYLLALSAFACAFSAFPKKENLGFEELLELDELLLLEDE
jgi:hypothetical protein